MLTKLPLKYTAVILFIGNQWTLTYFKQCLKSTSFIINKISIIQNINKINKIIINNFIINKISII